MGLLSLPLLPLLTVKPDRSVMSEGELSAIQYGLASDARDHSDTMLLRLTVPKCVYICKHLVLQQTLQSLSLTMHETKACTVGNDQIIGSVCIDVPPYGEYAMLQQRKFFGDYKLTEVDALDLANLAALIYLQKSSIILVDDINLSELTKREAKLADCEYKLLAASSWAFDFKKELPGSPPSNHHLDTSLLQGIKQNGLHKTNTRRQLFKMHSTAGSKTHEVAGGKKKTTDANQPGRCVKSKGLQLP